MKIEIMKVTKNMFYIDLATFICLLLGTAFLTVGGYRWWSKPSATLQTSPAPTLQQLISDLRHQLLEAEKVRRSSGEAALFTIGKCDIEVNVVVKNSDTIKGGFSYEVITAERASEYGTEQIQKITLHLDAVEHRQVVVPPSDPNSIK